MESPNNLVDFCPISLINSSLKIISELLAMCPSRVIDSLVDKAQSAFIKGRCILDNIVTTKELIFSLQKCRIPVYVLKVDFSKAFDMVSWNFLLEMLVAHGFGTHWVRWINLILCSSKGTILVNGS